MTPFKARRRPAPGQAPNAAGFTILETVIALCIMMVVGFGAVSFFLFSANYNSGASDRARSLALAQQRMEEYRAMPYSGIAARDTTEQVAVGSTQVGKSDMHTFQVKTTVEYQDTTAAIPASKRPWLITITVTPQAGGRWTAGDVVLKMVRATDKSGSF